MKLFYKTLGLLMLFSVVFSSCRTEDMEIINAPSEDVFGINTTIANLLIRTATNDGSYDNIIDRASCFDVQLPVTVIANGIKVVVETEDDLDIIEDIFDEFTDDTDTLIIIFPITIILDDYSQLVINNQGELKKKCFSLSTAIRIKLSTSCTLNCVTSVMFLIRSSSVNPPLWIRVIDGNAKS